jgi:predicted acyl esterase
MFEKRPNRTAFCFLAVLWATLGLPVHRTAGKETFMVPMSGVDPVTLATDVHLPPGSGPWPVILHRTPYGRRVHLGLDVDVSQFVERGYAFVIQDVRGMGGSQGVAEPFIHDAWCDNQDGVDTVAWILSQPWSNGSIGTYGASAPGTTSLLLSGTGVEGQVCQFVEVASSDMFAQAIFQGGAFRQSLVENWLDLTGMGDFMTTIEGNPTYGEPWTCTNAETRLEDIHTAGVFRGGWYDIFLQGTINRFVGIRQHGSPEARQHQRLVIGPWTHNRTSGQLVYPDAPSPPAAYADLSKWMDYWLKDNDWGIPSTTHREQCRWSGDDRGVAQSREPSPVLPPWLHQHRLHPGHRRRRFHLDILVCGWPSANLPGHR